MSETYVHRIGRTARAGREGIAIAFCDDSEGEYLLDIEKLTQQKIEIADQHEWHFPEAIPQPRTSDAEKKPAVEGTNNQVARRNQRSRRGSAQKSHRVERENHNSKQTSNRQASGEKQEGDAPKRRRRRRRPKRATPMPQSQS